MTTPVQIAADDERLSWPGAVSLETTEHWTAPWRLPYQDTDLYLPNGGAGCAAMPSGVRITFRTDATSLRCDYVSRPPTYDTVPPEIPRVDVRVDGRLHSTVVLDRETDTGSFDIDLAPEGHTRYVELWLPLYSQFRLRGLSIPAGATLTRAESEPAGWMHYGCSISQGRGAPSPSRTWLAQTARDQELSLTSLAMAGTCHLQPMFARLMRDRPARLLSVHAGTNIYWFGSLSRDTLQAAAIGFVRILREKHPETPILFISPTYGPNYERKPGPTKLTHRLIRDELATACDWLTDRGDRNLHYLDGLDLFGPDDAEYLLEPSDAAQRIHFSAAGHDLVSGRLGKVIQSISIARTAGGSDDR
jgi:hypothetical protein